MSKAEEYYRKWSMAQPKEITVGGRSLGKTFNHYMGFAQAYADQKRKEIINQMEKCLHRYPGESEANFINLLDKLKQDQINET